MERLAFPYGKNPLKYSSYTTESKVVTYRQRTEQKGTLYVHHNLHVFQLSLSVLQRNTQQHTDPPSNGTYLFSTHWGRKNEKGKNEHTLQFSVTGKDQFCNIPVQPSQQTLSQSFFSYVIKLDFLRGQVTVSRMSTEIHQLVLRKRTEGLQVKSYFPGHFSSFQCCEVGSSVPAVPAFQILSSRSVITGVKNSIRWSLFVRQPAAPLK